MQTTSNGIERGQLDYILSEYALGRISTKKPLTPVVGTDRWQLQTTKGKFHLKVDGLKSEIEVKRELDLVAYLSKQEFPCATPIANKGGKLYHDLDGRWLSVYKRLDGVPLRADELSLKQLEDLGRTMADLHIVGKGYKKGIDNRFSFDRVFDLYADIRNSMPEYFRKMTRTLDEEVEYLRHYLEGKLPKGVIHGEMLTDGVLFKGDRVTGILDFDSCCRGKFVVDLASSVNALCYKGGEYQLERFEALLSGYQSLRTLSLAEWDSFPNELRFSALRSTVTRLTGFFTNPLDASIVRVGKNFQEFYDRLRILRREESGGMESLLMAMATGYDYRKYQKVKAGERRSRAS